MDLNLKALIGITYLIPIAITLRKIYAPSFDMPDAITIAIDRLETGFERHGAVRLDAETSAYGFE